jgi:hypothetical protein
VLKYRGGTRVFHDNPEPHSEAVIDLPTWIGAWVGRSVEVPAKTASGKVLLPPMAVVIISRPSSCTSSDRNYYGRSMVDQYMKNEVWYRWNGLRDQPLFLFMDLDRLFNNFKFNVATIMLKINKHMVSVYGSRGRGMPVADRPLNPAGHQPA